MSSTAVDDQFNEDRADAIGQNGPSGMHYGIMEQAGCKHGDAPEPGNVSASVTSSPSAIAAARITGQCADGEPCGAGGHCDDCPNSPELPDSSPTVRLGDEVSSPAGHYRHSLRVAISDADVARGYIDVRLDPYRVCDLYGTGGGPREQMVKKLLRWCDKGQSESQVLAEIESALDRWHEMREEDRAAEGHPYA